MPNMANGCACTMLRRSVYEVPLSTCSYLPRSGPKGSGGRNCMSSTRIRMTDTAKLTALIAPAVEATGDAVVRVAMFGGTSEPTQQAMAARAEPQKLGCEHVDERRPPLPDTRDGADPLAPANRPRT